MTQSTIQVVVLDNPPVNALSRTLRRHIRDAIDAANADPDVLGVVLSGNARAFSGGADIAEFGSRDMQSEPDLNALIAKIESNPKPVVAALTGLCLGGGLELALGCAARTAHPDAQLAFPEVKLGLLPGAGGTQRLPRAIGAALSARMITSGSFHKAREFQGTALLQSLDDDPLEAAKLLALQLAQGQISVPRLRDLPLSTTETADACAILDNPELRNAPKAALEAIAIGARLGFERGLDAEAHLFRELHDSAESIALRYAFFAERKAGKLEGEKPESSAIKSVGIVGSGTMGRGIAISTLKSGLPVTLIDTGTPALDAARTMIARALTRDVEKGRILQNAADQALGMLRTELDLAALGNVDLVIEAVYEDMSTKKQIFARLDQVCRPDCLLASNTSMLDINEIASATRNPARVLGLHFFSPAHVMKLVEVVEGARTSRKTLATALAFARKIGKVAVIAGVTHGFIGNRMLEAYLDRAFIMVEEGVSPYRIDQALEAWGMAMGPFHMLDLAGNDVSYQVRSTRRKIFPGTDIAPLEQLLYEAERFGQKTGKGWYDYSEQHPKGTASRAVESMLAQHRADRKRAIRDYDDHEIVSTLIGALATEGRHIVAEGFARSEEDVDVVYLYGYGFPRHRGGPMHHARMNGLLEAAIPSLSRKPSCP
ncbi:3-hydroxyacyl-CoA dehydrogenase NAD-binding domain-containing protein [Castellaniella sp.]|uniref:3-hydroxyacyl-CoA dehydrogenase NAD-binding domain-containing protein n=1 Tax=Castellaniella sp. TaxID=1955812 RepID=UPI00355E011A